MKTRSPSSRIVHVPRRFVTHEWGGTETVILEVSRCQRARGWRPEIVTSQALSTSRTDTIEGIPVRRYRYSYPFFGLSARDRLHMDKKGGNLISPGVMMDLLRSRDVRLFHAHALKRLGGEVRSAARLARKPYVVSLHGGVFDVPSSELAALEAPFRTKLEWGRPLGALLGSRRVLDDADHVICVGEREMQAAREALSHDRVTYVPNGVDTARFAVGDGAAFRRRHGIPDGDRIILNVSRIDAQKNQALLFEAFRAVNLKSRSTRLVLIGPETQPEYAAALRGAIRDSGLADRVVWLPGLRPDDSDLVDAYHAADIFALPSSHEPFGIVVLEAWSAGVPVVASRVGGLRRLVADEGTGLVFDPAAPDAAEVLAAQLLRLDQDPALRRRLGDAGRREARRDYDWARVTDQLEAVYQQAEAHAAARYGKGRAA